MKPNRGTAPRRRSSSFASLSALGCATALVVTAAGCLDTSPVDIPRALPIEQVQFAAQFGVDLGAFVALPSGLHYRVENEGDPEGQVAREGDAITVHYTGWLPSGLQFDSSEGRAPLQVILGAQEFLAGFEEGLLGIRPGEVRLLLIPPHLGYGPQAVGGVIPANSWLVFQVRRVP